MPIVTIQNTREGTTPEQKAALIKGATDLLLNVLNKPPGLTFVVIQEVELEAWGVGGLPVAEYRRQASVFRCFAPIERHRRRHLDGRTRRAYPMVWAALPPDSLTGLHAVRRCGGKGDSCPRASD
jgi:4-oxalocrotonate tautomerase